MKKLKAKEAIFTENVGIGEENPSDGLLHLKQSSNDAIRMQRSGAGANDGNIYFGHSGGGLGVSTSGAIGVTNPDFFISSTGNIGIGTTNPTSKLEVIADSVPADTPAVWLHNADNQTNRDGVVISSTNNGSDAEVLHVRSNNTVYNGGTSHLLVRGDGNVGIGTTSPSAKLTISDAGSSLFSPNAYIEGLTADVMRLGFDSGGARTNIVSGRDSSIHGATNGYMAFETRQDGGGMSEAMRIDSAGNVGIGTTSPTSKLDVVDNDNSIQLSVRGRSSDSFGIIDFKNNAGTASKGTIKSDASNNLMFRAGPTNDVLTMAPAGNVGIGITNPGAKLHIGSVVASAYDYLTIFDSTSTAKFRIGSESDVAQNRVILSNNYKRNSTGYTADDTNYGVANLAFLDGEIKFATAGVGNNSPINRLIIDSAGNVGIGTPNPGGNLHIFDSSVGNNELSGIVLSNYDYGVGETDQSVSIEGRVRNSGGGDNGIAKIRFGKDSDFSSVDNRDGNIQFHTMFGSGGSASFGERMRITSGGNVGIGTTSPSAELDVIGRGKFDSLTGNNGLSLASNGTNNLNLYHGIFGSTAVLGISIASGGNVGIGITNPGSYKLNVNGTARVSGGDVTSDDRVKHNEQPIVGALETLSKITPKKYIKTTEMYDADHDFELDESGNPVDSDGEPVEHRVEAGVIAQQVLTVDELAFAVSPEGVDEDGKATSPHGLDYNSLFTYAIAAIQEQQQIIDDLKSQNELLKTRIENIESKI